MRLCSHRPDWLRRPRHTLGSRAGPGGSQAKPSSGEASARGCRPAALPAADKALRSDSRAGPCCPLCCTSGHERGGGRGAICLLLCRKRGAGEGPFLRVLDAAWGEVTQQMGSASEGIPPPPPPRSSLKPVTTLLQGAPTGSPRGPLGRGPPVLLAGMCWGGGGSGICLGVPQATRALLPSGRAPAHQCPVGLCCATCPRAEGAVLSRWHPGGTRPGTGPVPRLGRALLAAPSLPAQPALRGQISRARAAGDGWGPGWGQS